MGSFNVLAQETPKNAKAFPIKSQSVKPKKVVEIDSKKEAVSSKKNDTIKLDTVKKMKSVLEGKVTC